MPTRFLVKDKYQVTGRGPTVVGLLLEGSSITRGMVLRDETTGNQVEIRGIEIHTRQTPHGTQYGLVLDEQGAQTVQPNSILVGADPPT